MVRQSRLTWLTVSLMLLCLPLAESWGRGFGGGLRGGMGGRGGLGGGGFGGGIGRGGLGGGGTGGGMSRGGLGGGFGGGMDRGGRGGGGLGGGRSPGGLGGGFGGRDLGARGAGGFGGGGRGLGGGEPFGAGRGAGGASPGGFGGGLRGAGAGGPGGDRFSTPNRSQLNNFLGLPSDGGLNHLGAGAGRPGVGAGGVGGPDSGIGVRPGAGAGGIGGPDSGIGVRPGAGAGRPGVGAGGVGGPDSGIGVRPGAGAGRVGVGAGGVGGPDSGIGVRPGIGAGRPGVGVARAPFDRITPSTRHTTAAAVRNNFHDWGVYGRGWYTAHPGAWFATGWGAGAAWRAATWNSVGTWMDYYPSTPMYYDYGNNITYQGDNVYVNGQDAGTTAQYYQQASTLAASGAQANAPADGDWLPLGVFALAKPDHTSTAVTIQLAVNKQGIIRGNYTDTRTNHTQPIQGAVDKKTQRVSFFVGDNQSHLVETGLYNLTKDEAPVLLHIGKDRTEQWLLIRLKNPDEANSS